MGSNQGFTNTTSSNRSSGLGALLGGLGTVFGGPVGGLIGSLGSSLLGNRGAKRRQQLADQQNIRFWKMQNEYNLPVNQMKRLQDAGLNPNLIYGSGSANTGVAGSVAPSKPAPYNIKDPTPSMLSTALIQAQIANVNSVTRKNNEEANRIAGITPYHISKALSDANVSRQRAIIETINAGVANANKKNVIAKLSEEVLILKQKKKLEIAKTKFKSGMYDLGINPDTAVYNSIYQQIFHKGNQILNETIPGLISEYSGVRWNPLKKD